MQENICYKHEITREELKAGAFKLLSRINTKDYQNIHVIFALSDLLFYGDIEPVEGAGKYL